MVPPPAPRPFPVGDETSALALLATDEAALIEEIGRREGILGVSPEAGAGFVLEASSFGAAGFSPRFREPGFKVVARLERELYGLLCGTKTEAPEERARLRESLGLSEAAMLGGISSALVGPGGAPFLAPLVAAAVVRRGVNPAWEETCKIWSARLEGDGE